MRWLKKNCLAPMKTLLVQVKIKNTSTGTTNDSRHLFNVTKHSPRFSPPISQFTDKISPVCLPQLGDEATLTTGTYCYATGKNLSFKFYSCNYLNITPVIIAWPSPSHISISHIIIYYWTVADQRFPRCTFSQCLCPNWMYQCWILTFEF